MVSPISLHLVLLRKASVLLPACAFILLVAGCAGGPSITSSSPDRDIVVDGDMVEWIDRLTEIADSRLRVGVQHDEDFVYIGILSTQRSTVQQIAADGLTIWFDSTDAKEHGLGLRYPVGVANLPVAIRSSEEDRMARLRDAANQIDLYFEPEKPVRRPTASNPGLQAASGFEFGAFTMEIRIPRHSDRNDALTVPVATNGSVWLGFQTGRDQNTAPDDDDRDTMGGRGPTGGIGAVGRDFGGRGNGPAGMYTGPINTWINVSLGNGSR